MPITLYQIKLIEIFVEIKNYRNIRNYYNILFRFFIFIVIGFCWKQTKTIITQKETKYE